MRNPLLRRVTLTASVVLCLATGQSVAEDLIEHTVRQRLGYDPSTETGVVFHMIGALSRYGKP